MMDYSSTDEATTSEDDENSVERQQNLVARSLQFPRRRAKKRQAVLMPEVDLQFIQSQRVKQLVIHQGDFFSFASKKLKKVELFRLKFMVNITFKTWIGVFDVNTGTRGRSLFPKELWNCYHLVLAGKAKTTNSLEAWHLSLQGTIKTEDGKKPKFWKWLGQLKKECSLQHVKLISLRTGVQPKLNSSDKKQTARRQEKALTYNKNTILRYLSDHALFTRLEDC